MNGLLDMFDGKLSYNDDTLDLWWRLTKIVVGHFVPYALVVIILVAIIVVLLIVLKKKKRRY